MEAFRSFFNEPWMVVKPPASTVNDDEHAVLKKKTFDFALFLSQLEDAMFSNAVSFIECSALLFATLRALFSILNPKVKDASYYLLILLPISLLLPAMAQAKSVDENGVDAE